MGFKKWKKGKARADLRSGSLKCSGCIDSGRIPLVMLIASLVLVLGCIVPEVLWVKVHNYFKNLGYRQKETNIVVIFILYSDCYLSYFLFLPCYSSRGEASWDAKRVGEIREASEITLISSSSSPA